MDVDGGLRGSLKKKRVAGDAAKRGGGLVLFDDCFADDFFDAGDAVVDGHEAGAAQGAHAALFGFHAEDLRAGVLDDHVAHVVVEES